MPLDNAVSKSNNFSSPVSYKQTLTEFRQKLIAEKGGKTYLELQHEYGVNRYYLCRIVNKKPVKLSHKIRRKLGIVKQKRRPRLAIAKDDPASAAASIARNCDKEFVAKLIKELNR